MHSKGDTLFFDAIFYKASRMVVFNGTPEETVNYLHILHEDDRTRLMVFRDEDQKEYEVDAYLDTT